MLVHVLVPKEFHLSSIKQILALLIVKAALITTIKDVWSFENSSDG
jgi:hypothetical protein